jgi:NhaA family Na+:H+ antiporter
VDPSVEPTPVRRARQAFLHRLPLEESATVLRALRNETTGGFLLLVATAIALVWANSAWSEAYAATRDFTVGPASLHLDLDLAAWSADGLLAVFFLVAGLELKREFVLGELRHRTEAVLPVVAAVCGMAVPALVYLAVNLALDGDLSGWAVPTATDIAFALAVLALISSHLPTALRAFLLSLAVVDDLLAITVIALFFTDDLAWQPLLGAAALLAAYALLQHRRITPWWLLAPIGLAVWVLVHASGVHATVAGVAIGLLTRVRHDRGERESPAERLEHRIRPLSAGVCVPLFALFAAGVPLSGDALASVVGEPVALGVVLGLVVGKAVGISGGTWVAARFTRAELNPDLGWLDVVGVSLLAGIGFTVSLLIGELAFAGDDDTVALVKAAVLVGSLLAAAVASVVLRARNTVHRRLAEQEARDDDADGVPDVYQGPS